MDIIIRQAKELDIESILAIYSQPSIDGGKSLPVEDAREAGSISDRLSQ
ncbi:MAG: hypothetical protein WBB19_12275 [Desulforhopalus sp.]